jgi:RNA polymerase sigma-70 factor (ECF subfamily)
VSVSIGYEQPLEFAFRATLSPVPLLARFRRDWAKIRVFERDYGAAKDEQLMAWVVEGDRRSFDALVDRHLQRALRTAARIVGNSADAEEIAQEAMLRVWTRSRSWRPNRAKFTTWFYQIVINLAFDHRRRPSSEPLDAAADPADPSPLGSAALEDLQRRRAVAEAIRQLPARQRAALTLCYYEGLSGEEAASALSTSLKAVEGLLLRARRFLKKRLESQDV